MNFEGTTELYKNRNLILFCSIIILIILHPFFQNMTYGKWFLNFTIYFVSILAVISLKHNRLKLTIGLILALLSVSSSLFNETQGSWVTEIIQVFFSFVFFFFVATAIFISILKKKEVTSNLIFAALCAYLFIGFAYAGLYHLIELVVPNSFFLANSIDLTQKSFSFHYLYFSFTVLTTVGFGDVVPISSYAKSFVMIEEVTGIFYMAIFVSRLIAVEHTQHKE